MVAYRRNCPLGPYAYETFLPIVTCVFPSLVRSSTSGPQVRPEPSSNTLLLRLLIIEAIAVVKVGGPARGVLIVFYHLQRIRIPSVFNVFR